MAVKPFSQACANNQQAILEVLRTLFSGRSEVLEIGSGTGQHAVFCSAGMPWLNWQPSDLPANLPGVEAWRVEAGLANLRSVIELDVGSDWRLDTRCPWFFDAAFTANTLHIMPWGLAEFLLRGLSQVLPSGAPLAIYGPFCYDGRHTSESNERFDLWLKNRDPASGVRDARALERLAADYSFILEEDRAMPANNRLLSFRRV